MAVSVLELNVDLVGRTDHEGDLQRERRCQFGRLRVNGRVVNVALTFCSALPTPITKTFPPNAIDCQDAMQWMSHRFALLEMDRRHSQRCTS